MAEATLKDIQTALGMSAKEMVKEWKELTPEDKNQIKQGISDGSLTY